MSNQDEFTASAGKAKFCRFVEARSSKLAARARGFTLIELLVVISIMLILLGIAVPVYTQSVNTQYEYNLKQNLRMLNQAIDQYTLDKQRAPQSLDDLVSGGYLKSIPQDPITRRTDCWVPVQEDSMMAIDQTQPGIVDVHSCNDQLASDGSAYSSW